MATLPAGYIPQRKLPSASSSGSLDFIVCEVLYFATCKRTRHYSPNIYTVPLDVDTARKNSISFSPQFLLFLIVLHPFDSAINNFKNQLRKL